MKIYLLILNSVILALSVSVLFASTPSASPTADENSRAIALVEMQTMANAMEIFFLDTNYYSTLENLDDTRGPAPPDRPWQFIGEGGGTLVISPFEGDVLPNRVNLLTGLFQYQGPYITYQQNRMDGADSEYDPGTPLDPWGNPYYFYTPLGLLEPRQERITQRDYGDIFDRYTIVSFGPDGIQSSSDIIYQFGGGIQVATISVGIFRSIVDEGDRDQDVAVLEIRGYNLGENTGQAAILINNQEIQPTITQWSSTDIEATLDFMPTSGDTLRVRIQSGIETRTVELINEDEATTIGNWELFG